MECEMKKEKGEICCRPGLAVYFSFLLSYFSILLVDFAQLQAEFVKLLLIYK